MKKRRQSANRCSNRRPVVQPKNYATRLTHRGPVFQRLFFAWYRDNQHRFAGKIVITRRSRHRTRFCFPGITHEIIGTINNYEIGIHAVINGEHLDIIAEFPCFIKSVSGGFIDKWLLPEYQFVAPDKKTLYRKISFEPFLKWVNDHLFTADWLVIDHVQGSYSSAQLTMGPDPAKSWDLREGAQIELLSSGGSLMRRQERWRDDDILPATHWSLPVRVEETRRLPPRYVSVEE